MIQIKKKKQLCSGLFQFADLDWKQDTLYRMQHSNESDIHKKNKNGFSLFSHPLTQKHQSLILTSQVGAGKVTDCGYDQFESIYTQIRSSCDFVLEADIQVNSFLLPDRTTYQEGFGLFIRDTMDLDPETGYPYSNMLAAGGYYGGWNFFGRFGILKDDIENVTNYFLYGKESNHKPFLTQKDAPRSFHLLIERKGSGIRADMTDTSGNHLFRPISSENIRKPGSEGFSFPEDGSCCIPVPQNMFVERESDNLYLGFFAAGSSIAIPKRSVRLILSDRPETPSSSKIYASPGGSCMGLGTENSPYDLQTAIMLCEPGQEIVAAPGIYPLKQDLMIDKSHSGREDRTKKLTSAERGKAVLDFQKTSHALKLYGDFWEIDGLTITNGFGIQVQGNHNSIVNCRAKNNLETGILIRHEKNESDKTTWPSYNTIENCISCYNADQSGCNADGFACKVAAGEGNRFIRCTSYINADDGFDLFTKNRKIGLVELIECRSFLNGYSLDINNKLRPTNGNGTGFKLGGSGLGICHTATACEAYGNKGKGFSSNSNPQMKLLKCKAGNNLKNYDFFFSGIRSIVNKTMEECSEENREDFDPLSLWEKTVSDET